MFVYKQYEIGTGGPLWHYLLSLVMMVEIKCLFKICSIAKEQNIHLYHVIYRVLKIKQENYSMFLVTCYTEGFIEIWKFKII